jgi:hypothetical protein
MKIVGTIVGAILLFALLNIVLYSLYAAVFLTYDYLEWHWLGRFMYIWSAISINLIMVKELT